VRTDRGLDRFITFLDAIVAIAVTLLVLPLTDVIDGTHPPASAAGVFSQDAGRFWAFLVSFVVIARLWLAHHRMTERVGGYDTPFVWVNLGWALTVVFLPFATQLTSAYPATDRVPIAVYLGTLALSSAFLSVAAALVWRRPGLRRDGVPVQDAAPSAALATTVVLLLALAVGLAFPRVSYFGLLLLFASAPVERLLRPLVRR
jgi:uncharacterized membrane protein